MTYTNRKQIVILTLLTILFSPVFAQNNQGSKGYNDVKPFSGDSAFRKFSIGINVGVTSPSVIFGGSNDFANPQASFGYGANIRYQVNHYIAIQADFLGGELKGNQDSKYGAGRPVASFKTNLHWAASLSGVLTGGNINWLSTRTHVVPYIGVGLGLMEYSTKIVNAGSSTEVDYKDSLSPKSPLFAPVSVGLKINLSKLINLDLGYRMNFVDADDLDGLPYWNTPATMRTRTHKDKFSYGFIGIEFALGKKAKPQMLFDNPAARMQNYLQNQIDTLKIEVDLLSKDSDGDGIPDKFDKEPNTSPGCPVDSHGVSRDTDGDGVPDCKDKELVTPTQCQPVDADGVGKCPDPECCKNMVAPPVGCQIGDLPSVSFKGNSGSVSSDAKAMLATVASKLKDNADCSITVTGYPAASKASQALCNKRVAAIKAYLVEKEGISADRIDTNCEVGGGDINTVDVKSK
ncbi:MAG TPA: outer membrane beta-barrel protein [Ginsengibacter sp.]|nr:outer membrane beta-barrel protein [Ginsengibacter sp.]